MSLVSHIIGSQVFGTFQVGCCDAAPAAAAATDDDDDDDEDDDDDDDDDLYNCSRQVPHGMGCVDSSDQCP